MKTKLLLSVVLVSFLAVSFRSLPCIQAAHDCCKPVAHLTISDLYQRCCSGEQTNVPQAVFSSQKDSESAVTLQIAVSTFQPLARQPFQSFFDLVPKPPGSKTPTYLNNAHLLL